MKPESHVAPNEYAHEHPVLQNPGETRTLDHLPQLDGLRAIAVSCVLWSHFLPASLNFRGVPPWGAVGVGLFFVLSGFLITRILLNCRLKIETNDLVGTWSLLIVDTVYLIWRIARQFRGDKPPPTVHVRLIDWLAILLGVALVVRILWLTIWPSRQAFYATLKQFYVRRFLRIFPLYYGVLIVFLVFNVSNFRERAVYSVLYLTNYRFSYDRPAYLERGLRAGITAVTGIKLPNQWTETAHAAEGHLWSLSVEEQFYIVWPFLILFCPRRLLLPVILLTIAVGPVWRTYTYEPRLQKHEWMTPGCLDLLAIGALLAFLSLPKFGWSKWRDGFVQLCGVIGVPMAIAFMAQRWYPVTIAKGHPTAVSYNFLDYGGAVYPFTALVGVWLIGTAARGFRGPIGWFLTFPPIVYLGRISYGVYVMHLIVPHLLEKMYPHTFGRGQWTIWTLLLFVAIAVALASLSWFFYEAPINKLKRYFEYDRTASANAATPAVVA